MQGSTGEISPGTLSALCTPSLSRASPTSAVETIMLQADTDSEPMGRKCFVNSKYNYWTIIQEKNIIRF